MEDPPLTPILQHSGWKSDEYSCELLLACVYAKLIYEQFAMF